jgi:hypothetical protein
MANDISNFISNIYNYYKNKYNFSPIDKYLELQKKIDSCIDCDIYKIEKEFCNKLTYLKNGLIFWDILNDIRQRATTNNNNCIYAEKIILENGLKNCNYLIEHLKNIYDSLSWDSQIINNEYYILLNNSFVKYSEKILFKLNKINNQTI